MKQTVTPPKPDDRVLPLRRMKPAYPDAEKAAQMAAFGAGIVAWLAGERPDGTDGDDR